jgi:hypothetical protein
MPVLRIPGESVGLRQNLVAGRFSEAITERPIETFTASLSYAQNGVEGSFATRLLRKPGGYFALHHTPDRETPSLNGADPVTLVLALLRPDQPPLQLARDVPGSDLAIVGDQIGIGNQRKNVARLAGAPFTFVATVPPAPVMLNGLVLFDGDPEVPATAIAVRAGALPAVTTDPTGRFRIPALPVAETVTLTFDDGTTQTERLIRPDYAAAQMTTTFSIPSPAP